MTKMDWIRTQAGFMRPEVFLLFWGMLFFLCLCAGVWHIHTKKKRPAYQKKLPKVIYGDDVREHLALCYTTAKDVEGMLLLAEKHCRKKKARIRFQAAISYLGTSRYRDYETALYVYASDGTQAQKEFFEKIIQAEAAKYRRLPKKEESVG